MDVAKEWEILPEDKVEEVVCRERKGPGLRLLIVQPSGEAILRPCIVFIHGGGFAGGSPEMLLPQCRYFARLGYVCASVDYRRMMLDGETPVADSPMLGDQLEDCREAVRYMRGQARRWRIDPSKIALVGESAGGYLACGVAAGVGERRAGEDRLVSSVPDALIAYNPIVHLLGSWKSRIPQTVAPDAGRQDTAPSDASADNEVERWRRRHEEARLLSPLLRLTGEHPPALLMHGLMDTVVPPEHSAEYAERLRELGVRAELALLPASTHAFALFNYSASDEELRFALDTTVRFLNAVGIRPPAEASDRD
ncbi:alpha/beta hydrolase [Cohnella rhizosphaerae]|uniref:Alpha/beta hydrolase n=1 Tax=Cohnella rhizosphaerae TaxID=1457232 RepID=A0A9X4KPY5_9BACL|nr:alpha/beta hydrolase [Cohnella rhizosphaerae]MDG0808622.1 alpha/beta hydrolase [Cohnella rhizosphaerae]